MDERSVEAPVITIDGPSGVGKGTMTQLLARQLGWHLLDSGALYRTVALLALERGESQQSALLAIAHNLQLRFVVQSMGVGIFLQERELTAAIRDESCAALASKIAQSDRLREALVPCQRAFLQWPGLVTDGRDMGTVIFPKADVKFFLQADVQERAKRRHAQLKQKGKHVSLDQLLDQLRERDERDAHRDVAPLQAAKDAIVIETSHLTVTEVLGLMLVHIEQALEIKPKG